MQKLPFALSVVLSFTAVAQGSQNATGDFAIDLGQIRGATRAVKQFEEICTESFPKLRRQNEVAYAAWRSRYLPFIQEMEKTYLQFAWRAAKGNAQNYMAFNAGMDKQLDEAKIGLRRQLTSEGMEKFTDVCNRLPAILTNAQFDIEHHYAEQVRTVRRVLKE